jgi:hypothetical protein
MKTPPCCKRDFLMIGAIHCALVFASCNKAPTPGPAPLIGPEMPGDRFLQFVRYQEGKVGLFAHHRFVFQFSDCSPLDALEQLFETAKSTPRIFVPKEKISTPELDFSPDLVTALSTKKASGFFGVNHNGYPHFSVAEMVALICLDHDIDLTSADPRIYRFGIARKRLPLPPDPPVLVGDESGLSLVVSLPAGDADQGQVRLENRSAATIRIGQPFDMAHSRAANPFATWSVLPADDVETRHPGAFAADQMIPGCGTGWISHSGKVLELGPGESVDLTNTISLPWELSSGQVEGRFRAVLYLRNNPNLPLTTSLDFPEKRKTEIMASIRGTMDCLILSNEVVFEASKKRKNAYPVTADSANDQEPVGKIYYRPN